MKKFIRHSLIVCCAVLLGVGAAMAEDAPTPSKAPPRVPFTAFRIKPILKLKTPEGQQQQGGSLVVQDVPAKKPSRTIKVRQADKDAPITRTRPQGKPQESDDIIFSPQIDAPAVAARSTMGPLVIPVPARKPQITAKAAPVTIERVQARPAPTAEIVKELPTPAPPPTSAAMPATPAEPEIAVKAPAIVVPMAKPDFNDDTPTVRIRDPDRFSSHSRMGGSLGGGDGQARSLRSLGLPSDMQNLSIGSLKQGKGVSPVLMPGHSATMAAPDKKQADSKGIPSEVIVFFQENSTDLEVGQLDVVNSDVVAMLKNRPDLSLEIVGYAEAEGGSADAARKRSTARALMIRQYLIKQRIDGNRLTVEGKGDDTKIDPRDRVEMYFDR